MAYRFHCTISVSTVFIFFIILLDSVYLIWLHTENDGLSARSGYMQDKTEQTYRNNTVLNSFIDIMTYPDIPLP